MEVSKDSSAVNITLNSSLDNGKPSTAAKKKKKSKNKGKKKKKTVAEVEPVIPENEI